MTTSPTLADLLREFLAQLAALQAAAECARRWPQAGAIYLGAMAYHVSCMDLILAHMQDGTEPTRWEMYARLYNGRTGRAKREA